MKNYKAINPAGAGSPREIMAADEPLAKPVLGGGAGWHWLGTTRGAASKGLQLVKNTLNLRTSGKSVYLTGRGN